MKNQMWSFVSGWNVEKNVKQLFRKITLNGREQRDFLILRHVEKRSRDSKNVWICHPQCIYSEEKISSVYIKWF